MAVIAYNNRSFTQNTWTVMYNGGNDFAMTSFSALNIGTASSVGLAFAVGDGTKTKKGKFIPSSLSVGDHIMYTHGAGTPIKLDGVEMVIIKEEDVLGWVDND